MEQSQLYGRGYTDAPPVSYQSQLYVNQILGVLDKLGWSEPIYLAGLSMVSFIGFHCLSLLTWIAGRANHHSFRGDLSRKSQETGFTRASRLSKGIARPAIHMMLPVTEIALVAISPITLRTLYAHTAIRPSICFLACTEGEIQCIWHQSRPEIVMCRH